MEKPTENYSYETEKRYHTVGVEHKSDAFVIEGFRHYGIRDPAGLCDGGDYIRELRISRNADGTIRVRWRVAEWHREIGINEHDCFDVDFPTLFDALWPHLARVKAELKAAGKLKQRGT